MNTGGMSWLVHVPWGTLRLATGSSSASSELTREWDKAEKERPDCGTPDWAWGIGIKLSKIRDCNGCEAVKLLFTL